MYDTGSKPARCLSPTDAFAARGFNDVGVANVGKFLRCASASGAMYEGSLSARQRRRVVLVATHHRARRNATLYALPCQRR